jgi:predicted nucleic-acid-binding Zn-ribbon protein
MNLDKLSPKEFVEVIKNSIYLIKCDKCNYSLSQKKAFFSDKKDEKNYYIKCPKCKNRIYTQITVLNKKK